MLGMSKGAVNETALGDATRGRTRNDPAGAKYDRAVRQTRRQGRVAHRHQDGIAGFTTPGDPGPETRHLGIADVDKVNERLVGGAGLVERRAAVVEARASNRGGPIGVAKPRDEASVGRHQSGRTQEQRGLSRSARSHERHGFPCGDCEIHVGESVRARQTRPAARDEPFGDPGDFKRRSHANR